MEENASTKNADGAARWRAKLKLMHRTGARIYEAYVLTCVERYKGERERGREGERDRRFSKVSWPC